MLADHAWNGTDDANRQVNARLRQRWSNELLDASQKLSDNAWTSLGATHSRNNVTVFNPVSFTRPALLRLDVGENILGIVLGDKELACQIVVEDGQRMLYAVVPGLPPFGMAHLRLIGGRAASSRKNLRASPTELECPTWRLHLDSKTGAIASLVHKATGVETIVAGQRGLGQIVLDDRTLTHVATEVIAEGPVLSRIRVVGQCGDLNMVTFVTAYHDLDHLDLDYRIEKPAGARPKRLLHYFPVVGDKAVLRIETPAAVLRPYPQPKGDLLPGANTRRFAVQNFLDATTPGSHGLMIVPWDAFALRLDLDALAFEAMGYDQNENEVTKDQNGETAFRFRYSLVAHADTYNQADAVRWSRQVLTPLPVYRGRLPEQKLPLFRVDPNRGIVTCLKPADDPHEGDFAIRMWRTDEGPQPLSLELQEGIGYYARCDLVERPEGPFVQCTHQVILNARPRGFSAVLLKKQP
jgi:hypothetical protein